MRRLSAILLALTISAPAFADDKATAEVLFQEAQKLIAQNHYAEACPKLADSQRLDPGIGTALYLGDCYERIGKIASAWGSFREALSLAQSSNDKRAPIAKKRADALEPNLSRITLKLDAGLTPSSVRIEKNGKLVSPSEIGLAIPVDPGTVTITADAEGRERWQSLVKIEGKGNFDVVVKLGPPKGSAVEPPKVVTPPPTVPDTSHPPPTTETPSSSSSGTTLRIVGIGTGVLGLVAVGIGTGLAVSAKGTYDSSNQMGRCDANDFCNAEGLKLRSDAHSSADIATVMFIAGGVLVAAGVTLFLVAPKNKPQVAVSIGPSFGSFSMPFN